MIIWLASYPRSGNTLLRIILREAFAISSYSLYDDIDDFGNRPEAAAAVGHISHGLTPEAFYDKARNEKEMFYVKTHDAPCDDAPVIYVVRDGRSVTTSYAKYLNEITKVSKSVSDVILGDVTYGAWGDHYYSWHLGADRRNALFLRYEDLVTDLAGSVDVLSRFLKVEPQGKVNADFHHLKKLYPSFFRQGTLGGWGGVVSDEDKALFWTLNGDLMTKLDYGRDEQIPVNPSLMAAHFKSLIQSKERALKHAETQLFQAQANTEYLNTVLEERKAEISKGAALLIEEKARSSTLEQAAIERLQLVNVQAAKLAGGRFEAESRIITKARNDNAKLSAKLEKTEGHVQTLSDERDTLAAQMWQARERAAKLEAQVDNRRWRTWRADFAAFAARRGRWLAEGVLCQVFPPLPQRRAPKISVVTPVFNNADTIRETIESVLGQEGVELEYIIVDGGSTDGSVEIISEYQSHLAQFISEPDNGMYDAIAKGFVHATGDVFAYLNADDVYEHGALARVAEAFRVNPNTQVIYFEDSVTVHGWRFPNRPQRRIDFLHLLRGHILYQDGVFFTRRAYNFVGGLNRSMRAAGDWDLWVRLAYRFRFKMLPGHVSSFRIRAGQLSQDMATYNAEVEEARIRLRRQVPAVERAIRFPLYAFHRVLNKVCALASRVSDRRRLFFPMDFAQMPPPPGQAPRHVPACPRDPIDQAPPTDLLFSTRDTRFNDQLISYLYYHRDADVVSYYPPLDREELKDLYARNYNLKEPEVRQPTEGSGSPYRLYRSRRLILRKLATVTLPHKVRALMSKLGVLQWPDMSLEEINLMLKGLVGTSGRRLKFLDVGCFDGKLLDRLAQLEKWDTCGLEPNAEAAEIARSKGHRIWNVEVEEAFSVVPSDERFDVIFLGQTIEHFNDPLAAIIQLSQMLAPDGVIVLSTPNLRSVQIELFGPTWSHWHAPYHRHLFSPKSLGLLADRAGMKMVRYRTWSHPAWSWLSIKLHQLGLGGSVPHGITIPPEEIGRAESLAIFSRLFYDWRGKGDYIYAAYKKKMG